MTTALFFMDIATQRSVRKDIYLPVCLYILFSNLKTQKL